MTTSASPDSLEDCFKLVNKLVQPILEENVDRTDDGYISNTLAAIENCKSFVQREHIFSSNEELDDFQTNTLKVLLTYMVYLSSWEAYY